MFATIVTTLDSGIAHPTHTIVGATYGLTDRGVKLALADHRRTTAAMVRRYGSIGAGVTRIVSDGRDVTHDLAMEALTARIFGR